MLKSIFRLVMATIWILVMHIVIWIVVMHIESYKISLIFRFILKMTHLHDKCKNTWILSKYWHITIGKWAFALNIELDLTTHDNHHMHDNVFENVWCHYALHEPNQSHLNEMTFFQTFSLRPRAVLCLWHFLNKR